MSLWPDLTLQTQLEGSSRCGTSMNSLGGLIQECVCVCVCVWWDHLASHGLLCWDVWRNPVTSDLRMMAASLWLCKYVQTIQVKGARERESVSASPLNAAVLEHSLCRKWSIVWTGACVCMQDCARTVQEHVYECHEPPSAAWKGSSSSLFTIPPTSRRCFVFGFFLELREKWTFNVVYLQRILDFPQWGRAKKTW